jgi:hypothetical protein
VKGDTYKETVHDGSVSYPIVRVAPPPGQGKHAKTPKQLQRRAWCSALARKLKSEGIRNAYAQARAFVYADIYNNR